MINILNYGAVGDGKTINTEAFAKATEEAKKTGEAVLVPPGVFVTGTINLTGCSLHIEKGAVIKASEDLKDYPLQDYVHNELGILTALIVCFSCEDVLIDGEGTIDLSGKSFFYEDKPIVPESKVPFSESQLKECTLVCKGRPSQSIFFDKVKGITIKDIKVIDSPCWTFTFTECENIKVTGMTIDTDYNVPNDDGMHFCSCKGIIVSNCHIKSGDDCIAVSGITNWDKTCEDVIITDCVLETCSKAIAIGYIYSHVKNVIISNVVIKGSNRGLCFMCDPDCGLVENVRVKNLIIDTRVAAGNWWGNGEPIYMLGIKHDFHIPAEQKPERRVDINFKNIHFENISCISENAIAIAGTGNNFSDIYFKDIDLSLKASDNLCLKGNTMDTAPNPNFLPIPENCGFFINNANGINIEDVRLGSLDLVKA